MEKIELGDKLRELRFNKGWTQQEVANKINVSQSSYAYYETGKKEPKIDTLWKLAEIYQTSIDYIVGRYKS